MEDLVSIIMPCYNQGQYLTDALESVLSQTYKNWECIIINDGSTDNTNDIALEYTLKNNQIKYIQQPNSGVVSARNNGIRISKGKYILPLDADDKLQSTYIEKCVKTIASNVNIKVVYGKTIYFGLCNDELLLEQYSFDKLLVANLIHNTALHYKTDADRVGGYDVMMKNGLEDWEYWISILKNGGLAVKIEDAIFYYRKTASTRSTSYSNQQETSLRDMLYTKHKATYTHYFGDPISIIGEKDLFAGKLMAIRSNYLYKALKILGLLPKV